MIFIVVALAWLAGSVPVALLLARGLDHRASLRAPVETRLVVRRGVDGRL